MQTATDPRVLLLLGYVNGVFKLGQPHYHDTQQTIKPGPWLLLASTALLWVAPDTTTACLEPPESCFPGSHLIFQL